MINETDTIDSFTCLRRLCNQPQDVLFLSRAELRKVRKFVEQLSSSISREIVITEVESISSAAFERFISKEENQLKVLHTKLMRKNCIIFATGELLEALQYQLSNPVLETESSSLSDYDFVIENIKEISESERTSLRKVSIEGELKSIAPVVLVSLSLAGQNFSFCCHFDAKLLLKDDALRRQKQEKLLNSIQLSSKLEFTASLENFSALHSLAPGKTLRLNRNIRVHMPAIGQSMLVSLENVSDDNLSVKIKD